MYKGGEMPYKDESELPEGVRHNLPRHAQEIYLAAYNNAAEEYIDPEKRRGPDSAETVARKVAWSAVKKEFEKDAMTGQWIKKPGVHQ